MTHSLLTLSDCRCDPSGSAHFLYSHCRCKIPDNVDFLLQLHTLSSYCRCMRHLFCCTCNPSDTVKSLLTLHNVLRFPSYALYYSSAAKSSPCTPDATLLVLNTSFIGTTGVAFLIMKTFSSHHTPCHPAAAVTLLILCTL